MTTCHVKDVEDDVERLLTELGVELTELRVLGVDGVGVGVGAGGVRTGGGGSWGGRQSDSSSGPSMKASQALLRVR